MIQIDLDVLKKQADKFADYIHERDQNNNPLNFIDGNSVLVTEEGYKAYIPQQARQILNVEEWNESIIGSGVIKERIYKALDLSENLLNFNGIIDCKNHFDLDSKKYSSESEKVIYEIYRGNDDKAAFEHAIKVFGARYALIAYLFYLKDETRYLPAAPQKLDGCFKELNIDFKMSFNCSWDNYCAYIDIIRDIGVRLSQYLDLDHELRLLDAHSFVWIIGETKYIEWGVVSTDINTPMNPKEIINGANGSINYRCARCDLIFKKARRCPECGQAVEE